MFGHIDNIEQIHSRDIETLSYKVHKRWHYMIDIVSYRTFLLLKYEIQGVSVKVTFSPSMSQGLNLIKYW